VVGKVRPVEEGSAALLGPSKHAPVPQHSIFSPVLAHPVSKMPALTNRIFSMVFSSLFTVKRMTGNGKSIAVIGHCHIVIEVAAIIDFGSFVEAIMF